MIDVQRSLLYVDPDPDAYTLSNDEHASIAWVRTPAALKYFGLQDGSAGLDFTKEDVIMLTPGELGYTGFRWAVQSIRQTGARVHFDCALVHERAAGEALNTPRVWIRVPKLPEATTFVMSINDELVPELEALSGPR